MYISCFKNDIVLALKTWRDKTKRSRIADFFTNYDLWPLVFGLSVSDTRRMLNVLYIYILVNNLLHYTRVCGIFI